MKTNKKFSIKTTPKQNYKFYYLLLYHISFPLNKPLANYGIEFN